MAQESSPIRGKITQTFGEITFSSDFDSGNLDRVEECRSTLGPGTREFNLWTAPDCSGEDWETSYTTWFYYNVTVPPNSLGTVIRFNIQNMNKQCKLYQQGLTPITRTVPGRLNWERLRDRVEYELSDDGVYVLSFQASITDSRRTTLYFAFCFPHSYNECQKMLSRLDGQFISPCQPDLSDSDRIYYRRELLCYSLEKRRIDLITVSSHDGITSHREPRLPNLFPDTGLDRAQAFSGKKTVIITSRVHPGETPSSHVFNGFLKFILRRDDPRAIELRRKFVFKLIPLLNPDGVSRGHYRTDTCGINLNRFYHEPDFDKHPSIYAARSLILHYHQKTIKPSNTTGLTLPSLKSHSATCMSASGGSTEPRVSTSLSDPSYQHSSCKSNSSLPAHDAITATRNSGVAVYVDLHAHATKRGCFFYGNYFSTPEEHVESMLFPKLVSLNSPNLDFEQSLFSEKNMYNSDKRDGLSKQGSGRVAMYKATGMIHSYTLECNYNSGRQVNSLAPATLADGRATPPHQGSPVPHRFSIQDFEQIGHAVAVAVLDLYQINPWSRLANTEHKSLAGLRESLLLKLKASRAKRHREKMTSTKPAQPQPAVVTPASVHEPLPAAEASKLLILKNQRQIAISKGSSASIAYDIAFVTERRRARRNQARSGRLKNKQQRIADKLPLREPTEHVKPSVHDVVFPVPGVRTETGSHSTGDSVLEASTAPSLPKTKARLYMSRRLKDSKERALPDISVVKHKLNLTGRSPCESASPRKAHKTSSKVLSYQHSASGLCDNK